MNKVPVSLIYMTLTVGGNQTTLGKHGENMQAPQRQTPAGQRFQILKLLVVR